MHLFVSAFLMCGLMTLQTKAAPGDLDPAFGSGGIVVTPITDAANLYDEPNAIQVQPDGKIVVCGMVIYSDEETSYPFYSFLVRYNPTGTLDTSFGTNGKIVGAAYVGQNIALQPDGKIIAVGYGGMPSFAVSRFNPDGTPDSSFDQDGIVFIRLGAVEVLTMSLCSRTVRLLSADTHM